VTARQSMTSELVDVGGASLEVVRMPAARPDLPPLVWLHEGLGSVAMWRDFPARVAAATGAEAIVYSRRGYGRSSRREGPNGVGYLHDEALAVLPALLDRLGVERPLLVGHSDGASIALIYAGSGLPCAGVVAMAPHVSVEAKALAGIRAVGATWRSSGLPERLGRYHDDPEHAFRGWHDVWLDPAFRAWSIVELLSAIAAPMLAIQGEDDEYATPEQVEAIGRAARAPCEVVLLPGCRHSPHRDQLDRTLGLIAGFTLRVAGAAEEGSDD
jgi:pimeloyl-ACP methyl ester carboxylesterase